jgi:predicted outer membrane protein
MVVKSVLSSVVCATMLCVAVSAQETKPNQTANKPNAASTVTTRQLATCLALDNQEEVILAKFAQDRIENKEVAAFAGMIVDEHQACLKKLNKFAPEATTEGFLASGGTGSNAQSALTASPAPSSASGTSTGSSSASSASAGADLMQLQREVAQQCIADSKEYLSKNEGAEFDACFVGMQIAKHASMHTKLKVMQRHATDEIKPLINEGIQTTAKHLKEAERLMQSISSKTTDRRTSKTGE